MCSTPDGGGWKANGQAMGNSGPSHRSVVQGQPAMTPLAAPAGHLEASAESRVQIAKQLPGASAARRCWGVAPEHVHDG